jgi:tRNA threonylcarbamoyladenosine biosynthesis protein TsaE
LKILLESEEATKNLGGRIGGSLSPGDVVLLYGELGAGKSTLARGIFSVLGLTGPFPSPTYTYVIEYPGNIAHIDLYMADNEGFYRLGLEDYFDAAYITVVEWADKLPPGFKMSGLTIEVELGIISASGREASVKSPFDIV